MKQLNKAQQATRDELLDALRAKFTAIDDAFGALNALIDETVNPAIEAYNGALTDLESFRDEIVAAMEEYHDARSEKWQEGDGGSSYQDWKGEWENLDLTEVELAEHLDLPDVSHADDFETLPIEVES